MQWRVQDGFSILLHAADAVQILGKILNLSYITAVPQAQGQPHLILNLSAQPDKGTPCINYTTYRHITPESMLFGRAFPCILQAICEADPTKGPVWVLKLNSTDAYHCSTLRLLQVGLFMYVVILALDNDCTILCIDLVLPMAWVDSPKLFCAFSGRVPAQDVLFALILWYVAKTLY